MFTCIKTRYLKILRITLLKGGGARNAAKLIEECRKQLKYRYSIEISKRTALLHKFLNFFFLNLDSFAITEI